MISVAHLCIIGIVVSMVHLSLGKEINSTKDLSKVETTGFDSPWKFDEDGGSKSKSHSSSSSKSHGEGYGEGSGYGSNVRKEKADYGHSDGNSGSGYKGGNEQSKGKVHVFHLTGQGDRPIYAQAYGSQYGKQEEYEGNHGGYNHGSGYRGKEESSYLSEQSDKSGESEPHGMQAYSGHTLRGGSTAYFLSGPSHSSGKSAGYSSGSPSHSSGESPGYLSGSPSHSSGSTEHSSGGPSHSSGGPSHSSGGLATFFLSGPDRSSREVAGYSSGGSSHSSGGSKGHSSGSSYKKPIRPTIVRYQSLGSPASSTSDYEDKTHSRKPQFNEQIHGKIDENLSVFIRQLGNLPLARFTQNGNQKKIGEREGYLLLPVLPNEKQQRPDESNKQSNDYDIKDSSEEEERTSAGAYGSEDQRKPVKGPYPSYPNGYGLSPEISSYGNNNQQSYSGPKSNSYEYNSNSDQGPSVTPFQNPKKFIITFDNSNTQGGSDYGGTQKKSVLYASIPQEGNNGKYDERIIRVTPYEDKPYREEAGYKSHHNAKEGYKSHHNAKEGYKSHHNANEGYSKNPASLKNNYYDGGKVFELKPNGQQFFNGQGQSGHSNYGKSYNDKEEYLPFRHESMSAAKPHDSSGYGMQHTDQRQLNQLNFHKLNQPMGYQNQIGITNVRVKNPNANLYNPENHPQPYTGQNFPDIGFRVGSGYEQNLENAQKLKHMINHDPQGVSVVYKNIGHGPGGLGGLGLMPGFMGHGHLNLQPKVNIGYPGGNPLLHNNLVAQFNPMAKMPMLYNGPNQKTKSIALFLSKPNQLDVPGVLPPVIGANFVNPYKPTMVPLRPDIAGKYGNGLLALNLYPGLHGLSSALSPVINTDLINLY